MLARPGAGGWPYLEGHTTVWNWFPCAALLATHPLPPRPAQRRLPGCETREGALQPDKRYPLLRGILGA